MTSLLKILQGMLAVLVSRKSQVLEQCSGNVVLLENSHVDFASTLYSHGIGSWDDSGLVLISI